MPNAVAAEPHCMCAIPIRHRIPPSWSRLHRQVPARGKGVPIKPYLGQPQKHFHRCWRRVEVVQVNLLMVLPLLHTGYQIPKYFNSASLTECTSALRHISSKMSGIADIIEVAEKGRASMESCAMCPATSTASAMPLILRSI